LIEYQVLGDFAKESNRIEGIIGSAEQDADHREALDTLLIEPHLNVKTVVEFVQIIQPHAALRERPGMDVRVGNHLPPAGGFRIRGELIILLDRIREDQEDPFILHHQYECLHPFTDGNGRSGRALWLWQMVNHYGYDGSRGFLHEWYYQSLDHAVFRP